MQAAEQSFIGATAGDRMHQMAFESARARQRQPVADNDLEAELEQEGEDELEHDGSDTEGETGADEAAVDALQKALGGEKKADTNEQPERAETAQRKGKKNADPENQAAHARNLLQRAGLNETEIQGLSRHRLLRLGEIREAEETRLSSARASNRQLTKRVSELEAQLKSGQGSLQPGSDATQSRVPASSPGIDKLAKTLSGGDEEIEREIKEALASEIGAVTGRLAQLEQHGSQRSAEGAQSQADAHRGHLQAQLSKLNPTLGNDDVFEEFVTTSNGLKALPQYANANNDSRVAHRLLLATMAAMELEIVGERDDSTERRSADRRGVLDTTRSQSKRTIVARTPEAKAEAHFLKTLEREGARNA